MALVLGLLIPSFCYAAEPDSAARLPDRDHFDRFSRFDGSPGAAGLREVKFVITGLHDATTNLHLMNTSRYDYHYDFVVDALKHRFTLRQFNQQAYFRKSRTMLAGTILAYDDVQTKDSSNGVYTIEFWPSDPVDITLIDTAFHAIERAMPFAKGKLYYHPMGETQEQLYKGAEKDFTKRNIAVIDTYTLLGDRQYTAHNAGISFGRLIVMNQHPGYTPGISDIVVYSHPPNDLSHVSGIITDTPQAPLSHINLKAKQNNTPNIFLSGASRNRSILELDGKYVRFRVTERDYTLTATTREAAMRFHARNRPKTVFVPPRDLSRTTITALSAIRHRDLDAFGAKAANLGELRSLLRREAHVPSGYAVPFSFYHQFMQKNRFYDLVRELQANTRFTKDPAWRETQLKELRKRIKKAPVSKELRLALEDIHRKFPAGTALRCRSSTNSEDLKTFNGAGLYDSYTHHPDEGHLEKSVKQVWASLWNYRAYEEREYHRIDHFATAMGVLIHPNFSDERANGVALTKNPFYRYVPGSYINVQLGESLVTNPQKGALPDEILIMQVSTEDDPMGLTYETIYTRRSTLTKKGQTVMTSEQLSQLHEILQKIETRFSSLYGADPAEQFGVDIEFKIDRNNRLVIKQARPWID